MYSFVNGKAFWEMKQYLLYICVYNADSVRWAHDQIIKYWNWAEHTNRVHQKRWVNELINYDLDEYIKNSNRWCTFPGSTLLFVLIFYFYNRVIQISVLSLYHHYHSLLSDQNKLLCHEFKSYGFLVSVFMYTLCISETPQLQFLM